MRCNRHLAFACLLGSCATWAQTATPATSVALYGSVDVGIGYIDNAAGRSVQRMESGALYANRLGFRGTENLGDGLSAVFVLETGFNATDGSLTLGGRAFGRQSYVGLASTGWGTLTLGRQYDFLYAGSPLPLDVGALMIGGLAGATGGAGTAVDNHSGGIRYDNTVKWVGRFGSWTLGAMVGRGDTGTQRMRSFVASYRSGALWAGIGHTRDDFSAPATGNAVTVASLNWEVPSAGKLIVTLSEAKADTAADPNSRSRMVQLGWLHNVAPTLLAGPLVGYADTRNAARVEGSIRQVGLTAQYLLSRRTTLYALGSQVRTTGSAGTAYSGVPGVGAPAATMRSDDGQQNVIKLGLLHKF